MSRSVRVPEALLRMNDWLLVDDDAADVIIVWELLDREGDMAPIIPASPSLGGLRSMALVGVFNIGVAAAAAFNTLSKNSIFCLGSPPPLPPELRLIPLSLADDLLVNNLLMLGVLKPVGVVILAQPVGVGRLDSPVGVSNPDRPVGVVISDNPEGVIRPPGGDVCGVSGRDMDKS